MFDKDAYGFWTGLYMSCIIIYARSTIFIIFISDALKY